MGDLLECSFCLGAFSDPQMLPGCGHTFCRGCVNRMRKSRCPLCHEVFDPHRVSPNLALQHILDASLNETQKGCSSLNSPSEPYKRLGVPPAFARELSEDDAGIALRIYLLDNSGSMRSHDGNVLQRVEGGRSKLVPATRWEELSAMALQQARWNVELGVPCEFQLLNSHSPRVPCEGVDIFRVHAHVAGGDVEAELRVLREKLAKDSLNTGTPLASRLNDIRERLARTGSEFAQQGRKMTLTIATDGVPNEPRQEFLQSLRRIMRELPIVVVIRLCTDEEEVTDFYNEIDKEVEMPLDILDDLRGEARNVYQANPWLAYSPMLHYVRVAGTFTKIFDFIDERALTAMEVAVCAQLLVRRDGSKPYSRIPRQFLEEFERDLPAAGLVFDARTGGMIPPVDIARLRVAVCPEVYSGAAGFPTQELVSAGSTLQSVPLCRALMLQRGAELEYYSQSQSSWYPCVITDVDSEGSIQINIKPGVRFTAQQRLHVFRPKGTACTAAAPKKADSGIVAGAQMEYWADSKQAWFSCTILGINSAGAVIIDLKPQQPLTAEQVQRQLRPLAGGPFSPGSALGVPAHSTVRPPGILLGTRMEYWSERRRKWYPCTVTHVDPACGSVTIDLKRCNPLSREQATSLLRPFESNGCQSAEQVAESCLPPEREPLPGFAEQFPGMAAGMAMEYFSESRHSWFPCKFTHLDPNSGAVTIDIKPDAPLTADQARTCLRLPSAEQDGFDSHERVAQKWQTLQPEPALQLPPLAPVEPARLDREVLPSLHGLREVEGSTELDVQAQQLRITGSTHGLAVWEARDVLQIDAERRMGNLPCAHPCLGASEAEARLEMCQIEFGVTPAIRAKQFADSFVEENKALLRRIFDICDANQDGRVSKFELAKKLRDSDEVSKVLEDDRVRESLEEMLVQLDVKSKSYDRASSLSWQEFRDMFCMSLEHHEVALVTSGQFAIEGRGKGHD